MNRGLYSILLPAMLLLAGPMAYAQDVAILEDQDAGTAPAATLEAEAQLFETIRQGIALSLAQCEINPRCNATVNREELRRIVGKLETRLDALTARHSESGDPALEPVLLAYVETRDGYNKFLEQADAILPPERDREQVDLGTLPEEFSIFSDAEAALVDDESEPAPQ